MVQLRMLTCVMAHVPHEHRKTHNVLANVCEIDDDTS